jgi:hypothetical protein
VAVHDFFDSPHSYGDNLHPDFLIWLEEIGELSSELDYDFYLKTHPDVLGNTHQVVADFNERYPKFRVLPPSASHHQLLAEGIDVALTVYGTIAVEYPFLGRPVVNASLNNPHSAYSQDTSRVPRSTAPSGGLAATQHRRGSRVLLHAPCLLFRVMALCRL